MYRFWEHYEKMDEMVYVSDIESYEIVYMNAHLRHSLGFESHADYKGKKCYKVLQGFNEPCSFCTNQSLKENEFISWKHANPILNKRFLIKDSLVKCEGRDLRIEVAIDIDSEVVNTAPYYYARNETILNECLHQVFSTNNPTEAIEKLLEYIGKTFLCDRAYIFEIHDGDKTSNTYEWCAEGVTPQKQILKNEPLESIGWWIKEFEENNIVVINDLEEIRTKYPAAYATLKPQDISTLAVGSIVVEDKIVGFIGVDNPDPNMMSMIMSLIKVIGYFTSSLLKRRDLLKLLNKLSYYDQLTGALNRNAIARFSKNFNEDSLGVIFCDITGLKRVNDSLGHAAGDKLICDCYSLICSTLETDMIYRMGGDEFIVLYPECEKEEFNKKFVKLQDAVNQSQNHIAVGKAWSDTKPISVEKLISQADQQMYLDKNCYYKKYPKLTSDKFEKKSKTDLVELQSQTEFNKFFKTAYFDAEALFKSISQENSSSYFYFGDMQKDIFYISDNLKEDFGFASNVVSGLLEHWAKRISTPEFQELFWQDLSNMIKEKRTVHDLRYQMKNIYDKKIWIRCYGILKWNEDKTKPLFFSGRVTHQDEFFVIDPVTNFPREHTAYIRLKEYAQNEEKQLLIGFTFSNIAEINGTRGRNYVDKLIKNIAEELMEKLSWKMDFYRLEGMRCMAIVDTSRIADSTENLIQEMKKIIEDCYHRYGIDLPHCCAFGVMEYPCESLTPEDVVENIVSLLRVAKQNMGELFIDYYAQNICQIKQMSEISLTLMKDILNGMKNFRIVVQPVVSAKDGSIVGGEILLRWKCNGKDIPPSVFIPIAEKENLINIVGKWVFEEAVCTCSRTAFYAPKFYLTFNVSLQQLYDDTFLDFMEKTLKKYQIDGSNLIAELTENFMDEQKEKLEHFIESCHKMNIKIALDDFGSGYSSFRMLLQYSFNLIKLDKSLLTEMSVSEEKKNFISSIVYACHKFGKKVCMEGVETQLQNEIIKEAGCDVIQGYYYFKPMELLSLYKLISDIS